MPEVCVLCEFTGTRVDMQSHMDQIHDCNYCGARLERLAKIRASGPCPAYIFKKSAVCLHYEKMTDCLFTILKKKSAVCVHFWKKAIVCLHI